MPSRINLTGTLDNNIEVIEYAGNKRWHCKCHCGRLFTTLGYGLRTGQTKSCGCLPTSTHLKPHLDMCRRRRAERYASIENAVARFWKRVRKDDGDDACWEWIGKSKAMGYGQLKYGNRIVSAHRFSYEIHVGPIPDGLFICHKCDNPPCVRPDHLFAGTPQQNTSDMFSKGRSGAQRKREWEFMHIP